MARPLDRPGPPRPKHDRPSSKSKDHTSDDPVLARLRKHLEFLGLTLTLAEIDERLAWATHERPGPTQLLEHVLSIEAAHKLERRIACRVTTSGLTERKSLEGFEWAFQPSLD